MRRLAAVLVLVPVAAVSAQTRGGVQAVPRRAAKLTLTAPARPAAPAVARRDAPMPALNDAARRNIAIDAGMPHTFALSKTPVTLSARRMYVDGVARLESTSGHFVTNPQYDYVQVDNRGKSLDIKFNVAKPNTFVLILVRGWAAHPNRNTPPYLRVPGSEEEIGGELGSLIPFVLECRQAGWHHVSFSLAGPGLSGLGITGLDNFYVVRSIELSTFS